MQSTKHYDRRWKVWAVQWEQLGERRRVHCSSKTGATAYQHHLAGIDEGDLRAFRAAQGV